MIDNTALQACPFCGESEDIDFGVMTGTMRGLAYVQCQSCGAEIHGRVGTTEVVAAWNRRAESDNEPLMLDELREMAQDLMAWCVVHECDNADCTAIIDYDNLGKYGEKGKIVAVTSAYGEPLKESDYGKTWLAYRRKPEEDAK